MPPILFLRRNPNRVLLLVFSLRATANSNQNEFLTNVGKGHVTFHRKIRGEGGDAGCLLYQLEGILLLPMHGNVHISSSRQSLEQGRARIWAKKHPGEENQRMDTSI